MITRISNRIKNLRHGLVVAKFNYLSRFFQRKQLTRKLKLNKPKVDILNIHSSQERFVEILKADINN